MSGDKWFHRGKEARSLGHDRTVNDGRLSPASRQQFYAGWDEQDHLMSPQASAAQKAATIAGLREIRRHLEMGR